MILGGVLTGGASRRMGRPKDALLFGGKRLDAIAEAALMPHCEAVHRLGPGGLSDPPGVRGPIAGIIAARRHAPEAWWIILACDMPLVRPEAVAWLIARREAEAVAVLPRLPDQGVQPTFALYGPGVDPLLKTLKAPRHLADHALVSTPEVPEALRACWTNVKDPQALEALSQR